MLFSTLAFAQTEQSTVVYKIAGKSHQFLITSDKKYISEHCVKNKKCMALATRLPAKESDYYGKGGANPAAIYCQKGAGGTVVLGYNTKFGQKTFCKFKDGSMIDNTSLAKVFD